MKVFFDIITNHTADVIDYQSHQYGVHRRRRRRRTRMRSGNVFDDKQYAGGDTFPPLDTNACSRTCRSSGPTADETVKVPAWLNDPTLYHNRGDSTFAGESARVRRLRRAGRPVHRAARGPRRDDRRLQDLGRVRHRRVPDRHRQAREHRVLAEVLAGVLDRGQDAGQRRLLHVRRGVRREPAVHVARTRRRARCRPRSTSASSSSAVSLAKGDRDTQLQDFFAGDDYYTDADSNAYQLPTFLGNHDMGRVGMFLKQGGAPAPGTARARQAGALADVPDPRPAGHLLRRRAGVHRSPAATRTRGRTCSRARSPTTTTTRSSTARYDDDRQQGPLRRRRPDVPAHRGPGAARGPVPGAGRRRADRTGTPSNSTGSTRSAGSAATTSSTSWPRTTRRRPRPRRPDVRPERPGSSRSTAARNAVKTDREGRVPSPCRRCPCRRVRRPTTVPSRSNGARPST